MHIFDFKIEYKDMEKVSKTQIKEFKCIKPIVAHWGVDLELGEIATFLEGGSKKEKIIFDLDTYLKESPLMPEFSHRYKGTPKEQELKETWKIYSEEKEKIKNKFSIEIEYNWFVLLGQDNENEFKFIFESEDEIKESYNIDPKCKIHFEYSVYHFTDYFDKTQLNREYSIMDLLD